MKVWVLVKVETPEVFLSFGGCYQGKWKYIYREKSFCDPIKGPGVLYEFVNKLTLHPSLKKTQLLVDKSWRHDPGFFCLEY